MKKILVLGSSPDHGRFVKSAKEKGLQVIVVDGNPVGSVKEMADVYHNIDVRDIDRLECLFFKNPVEGIVTGYSEVLLDSYVELADKLRMRSYLTPDQLKKVRVKSDMKKMIINAGLNIPKYKSLNKDFKESDLQGFIWPLIIKPEESYGSKGVFVVKNVNEIKDNFNNVICHSKFNTILVEEYCRDDEHNALFWIADKRPNLLYLSDRVIFGKGIDSVGYCYYHFYISQKYNELYPYVIDAMDKIIHELELNDGPFSLQCFYREGILRINEVAGRMFGFGDPVAVKKLAGFGTEDLLIDYALGRKCNIDWDKFKLNKNSIYVSLYMYVKPGYIKSIDGINFLNKIPDVYGYDIYFKNGDTVHMQGNRYATAATFFIKTKNSNLLPALFNDIYNNFKIINNNGENLIIPACN